MFQTNNLGLISQISNLLPGWYSTGSYFWAKSIAELFPTLVFSTTYSFLIYYLSGQVYEQDRLLGYMLLIVMGYMVAEVYGHIIGIVLQNFPQIAVMAAIGLIASMSTFSNYFVLIADLPVFLQYISDFSYLKYIFNSALILVYGLNRCSAQEKSIIMLKYNLTDDMLINNYYKLLVNAIFVRIITLIILYLKTETKISLNLFKKRSRSTDSSPDNSIELKNNNNKLGIDKMFFDRKMSMALNQISIRVTSPDGTESERENNVSEQGKTKICIAWIDLTISIPKSLFNDQKVILRQINGFFEFGTLNALMGSSGAGKTTLLKAINGLYSDYLTEETVIRLSASQRIRPCFVTQNQKDHILTGLTASQAMTYASKLKNHDQGFNHKMNVEEIMFELLISDTFDTNVENCSGGEQKRLVIAMELTSKVKPNLLCIDEPTSGLDSNAAEVLVKCLKKLSKHHNICVITSIHQPNTDILMMFDKLYVLSRGGHSVYSGRPQQLSQYLDECDIECTDTQLPIEVLLKQSCNDLNDTNVERMVEKTRNQEKQLIESRAPNETLVFHNGIRRLSKRFYIRDLWLLLKRGLTYNLRFYWKISVLQLIIHVIFALMLRVLFHSDIGHPTGCVSFEEDFNNTCAKSESKIREENQLMLNLKFNFYVMICAVFFTVTATVFSFAMDLKMFINEQRNGWYSTGVYYWSKTLIELITQTIIIVIFSFVVDLYDAKNSMFYNYAIYLTIGALEVQSLGQVMGILTADDPQLGVFALVGCFVFSFLFCNVLIPVKELHYSLQVLSNFASLKLLFESVMILFYGLGRCSDREFSLILFLLDVEDKDLYINLQLLVVQFFIFRAIALTILLLKVSPFVNNKEERIERELIVEQLKQQFSALDRSQINF